VQAAAEGAREVHGLLRADRHLPRSQLVDELDEHRVTSRAQDRYFRAARELIGERDDVLLFLEQRAQERQVLSSFTSATPAFLKTAIQSMSSLVEGRLRRRVMLRIS
jgi:predicted glycoside hydrolase/deacetylase ChbG (UPF0249 family)